MNAFARIAALSCAVAALAACDPATVHRNSTDATRYFAETVLGDEYDVFLVPAETEGPGALVFTRTRLTFDDGFQIPLHQVGSGVYRTPSLRSRLSASGSRLCGGQPVTYLALHRGPGERYYLNVGDWEMAPKIPAADMQTIPGACQTASYTLGAEGS